MEGDKSHNRSQNDQNSCRSISTLGNCSQFSVYKTCTINKKFGRYCRSCHYLASSLFRIWVNQTMKNFYNLMVAYSKLGSYINYRITVLFISFRIWQKSYSTTSKVMLKDAFYWYFSHYWSQKTVKRFVELIEYFDYFLHE